MATRSLIAIKNPDDTYDAVYCHFDGYPEYPGVGHKLNEYYVSEDKIRALIEKGDMSALGSEIEKCEFYTKRNEELHNLKNVSLAEMKNFYKATWCEYMYIFDKNKWTCK